MERVVKKSDLIAVLVIFIAVPVLSFLFPGKINEERFEQNLIINDTEKKFMEIKSDVFKNGEKIPPKYTCDGENVSPPLSFGDIPPETVSLVLIMDDPDAQGGIFDHWIAWNIPAETGEIPENGIPTEAVFGRNGFGTENYGGPCPPSGVHRYFFRLYALDTALGLEAGSNKDELKNAMEGHVLADAELFGVYGR
jgi:Raf kinase inhibitor-like YbhB/YbcL family protein